MVGLCGAGVVWSGAVTWGVGGLGEEDDEG